MLRHFPPPFLRKLCTMKQATQNHINQVAGCLCIMCHPGRHGAHSQFHPSGGGSSKIEIQRHPRVHRESEASLGYMRA